MYSIEKIIIKAYHQAEDIMKSLELTEVLKKNKLHDVDTLSSFVFRQLDKKLTVDYSVINSSDAYDSLDDDDVNEDDDDDVNGDDDVDDNDSSSRSKDKNLTECSEDFSDGDDQQEHHLTTSKQTFQGMKIYEKINPTKMTSYFQISINNKRHYIHKQTAARLLTVNKNRLSSDRSLRVEQTSKQQ
ncbi:hypothetical protein NGRA_3489 [Nosema granulosis]|uniref:Uncharacterized protein n=1 Tax=Nosema granulosis TaxID=83296 RepID=A0A9P6KXG1_9MICR|nr:hypothetical protein NGRA_3489 [Nosema granulosis]